MIDKKIWATEIAASLGRLARSVRSSVDKNKFLSQFDEEICVLYDDLNFTEFVSTIKLNLSESARLRISDFENDLACFLETVPDPLGGFDLYGTAAWEKLATEAKCVSKIIGASIAGIDY